MIYITNLMTLSARVPRVLIKLPSKKNRSKASLKINLKKYYLNVNSLKLFLISATFGR
jgi:hypothetical protein